MSWQLPALGAVGLGLWVDAMLGHDFAGSAVFLVLVVVLAFLAGWHSRLPELLGTCLVVIGLLTLANQVASPGEFSLANDSVFYAVVVLAPALAGWLLDTRSRQVAALRLHTADLERLQESSVSAARSMEAGHIERQIDHALAKRLGEIIAGVRDADSSVSSNPSMVPTLLATVEMTARDALSELRELLGVLQPGPPRVSTPTAPRPQAAAIQQLDRFDLLLLLSVLPLAVETSQVGHRGPIWLNITACVIQGLLLPVVRRRPIVGSFILFVVASAATARLTPLAPTVSWMVPGLLVPFLAGASSPRRMAPFGLVLALIGFGAVTFATPQAQRSLDGILPGIAMIILAWWAGRSLAARDARAVELQLVLNELARARDEQIRLAASEQRAEMARDLHDVGAHALTVICLQAGAVQKLWEQYPDRARAALSAVRQLADGSLSRLGESLGGLLEDESRRPLDSPALDILAGLGRVLGLEVTVDVHGEPCVLDEAVARTAFRVVQESLTNAARHAAYSNVEIDFDYSPNALEVHVCDSGPGRVQVPPPIAINGSGSGLRGMRERVHACGGDLSCGPSGTGFAVHARLPLEPVS